MKFILDSRLYTKYLEFSGVEKILMWVCVGYLLCWILNVIVL